MKTNKNTILEHDSSLSNLRRLLPKPGGVPTLTKLFQKLQPLSGTQRKKADKQT